MEIPWKTCWVCGALVILVNLWSKKKNLRILNHFWKESISESWEFVFSNLSIFVLELFWVHGIFQNKQVCHSFQNTVVTVKCLDFELYLIIKGCKMERLWKKDPKVVIYLQICPIYCNTESQYFVTLKKPG